MRGLPRNCGQPAADGLCRFEAPTRADGCGTKLTRSTKVTKKTDKEFFVIFVVFASSRRPVQRSLPIDRDGKQLVAVVEVQPAVRGNGRGVDGAAHVHLAEDLLRLARLEHRDVAVLVAAIDPPV